MLGVLLFVISALVTPNLCGAYNILVVFPMPGKSHSILGHAFVNILLEAGHEVTYITPLPMKDTPPGLRQINVSKNFDVLPAAHLLNVEKMMKKEVDVFELSTLFEMMYSIVNSTLTHEDVQALLHDPTQRFDAVLVEWMYNELYAGFATVFECPLLWSSSMEAHYLVLSLIDEDQNPSYNADIFSGETPPLTFTERALNLWSYVITRYKKWSISGIESTIFETGYGSAVAKKGRKLPSFDDAVHNGSLMFGNSHVSTGQAMRLPQNYIPIAGYHIDPDVEPLPKDLQKIMDDAKHGVIYFSMGSLLKSYHLPDYIKKDLLAVFAGLQQTVLWKFEEELPNRPKNVHIIKWAPQQSILSHPNCVIFITHGGLLSTTEALHYGVPIIGIPMFADQFNNVNRAVSKGFAKRVDLDPNAPGNLKTAIEGILGNPRYREKVKELSFVYHHRPVTPRKEIVHWVEHAVRTRGAPHLRSFALAVPLYQKMYLDLLAVVLCVLLVTYYFVKKVICAFKKSDSINMYKKNQ